jgi:hypothetical protein
MDKDKFQKIIDGIYNLHADDIEKAFWSSVIYGNPVSVDWDGDGLKITSVPIEKARRTVKHDGPRRC